MDQGFGLITGRLTGDPKLFGEDNPEKQRAVFTIAFNRGRDDNRKANFFDCIAWGKRADIMRDFKKGLGISVTGDLEQDTYMTKDGNKRSRVQLNVSSITATTNLRRNENVETPSVSSNEEEVTIGGVEDGEEIPF